MTIDEPRAKLRFGPVEWCALLALFVGPTISFGAWAWKLSDRTLLLESSMQRNADILKRLDNARESTAVLFERQDALQRRVEHLEQHRDQHAGGGH